MCCCCMMYIGLKDSSHHARANQPLFAVSEAGALWFRSAKYTPHIPSHTSFANEKMIPRCQVYIPAHPQHPYHLLYLYSNTRPAAVHPRLRLDTGRPAADSPSPRAHSTSTGSHSSPSPLPAGQPFPGPAFGAPTTAVRVCSLLSFSHPCSGSTFFFSVCSSGPVLSTKQQNTGTSAVSFEPVLLRDTSRQLSPCDGFPLF